MSDAEVKSRDRQDSEAVPEEQVDDFDLNVALSALRSDSRRAAQKLAEADALLCKLRASVVTDSRANFKLERSLGELDEKIKLLLKHRINVEEAQSAMRVAAGNHNASNSSPLEGKRALYEDLFYLLQSKPRYFAKLSTFVPSAKVHQFVQSVVFDMYGDQYDTREERLLLAVFKKVVNHEMRSVSDKGSLFRANTCATSMLTNYAKRGQGLSVLRNILEPPMKEMNKMRDLNLEIKPRAVYMQLIKDFETKTGEKSPLDPNLDDAKCAENEQVQQIIAERVPKLVHWAELILNRIIDGIDTVPYGVRWVCKQLRQSFRHRFPDATRVQEGSIVGGYISLRFFNPAIVSPDGHNFIPNKPSRVMRRNLVLIAKVLQNLSNGLLFGKKEPYMTALNEFIREKTEVILSYFDRLTHVEDVGDALQVDKYLEHTHSNNSVSLSFNQIFLIHRLLLENIDAVCKVNDPVRPILEQLGPCPADLPRTEDRPTILQLQDRRENRLTTTDAFAEAEPEVNPLHHQAKTLLLSVLRLLPERTDCTDLLSFLEHEKKQAEADDDSSLADHVNNVCSMLHTLAKMGLLENKGSTKDTFDNFLWTIASESMERNKRIEIVQKRTKLVQEALRTIQEHHQYLQGKLDMYRQYLDNVRQGGNRLEEKTKDKKKKKKKKKEKLKVFKVQHTQLEESGVIQNVDSSIGKGVLKKCYYNFVMVEPGKFEITLHIKKGFDVKLMRKPIVIVLEDLLTKQEHGETTYPLEYVDLNVNLLVHLLNKQFMT